MTCRDAEICAIFESVPFGSVFMRQTASKSPHNLRRDQLVKVNRRNLPQLDFFIQKKTHPTLTMKLINSSVLLGVIALSSMADRASAQMPSIEDVIAMISGGQVEGTDQPEVEPQSSSIVADTAPVRPVVPEEEEPQVYVAPEIENFSATGDNDVEAVEADGVVDVLPADPMPVPSAAPSAPPKPITCIDRSLEVCRVYHSIIIHNCFCMGRC